MPKEALRYLRSVKELLRNSPVEDDTYTDVKGKGLKTPLDHIGY